MRMNGRLLTFIVLFTLIGCGEPFEAQLFPAADAGSGGQAGETASSGEAGESAGGTSGSGGMITTGGGGSTSAGGNGGEAGQPVGGGGSAGHGGSVSTGGNGGQAGKGGSAGQGGDGGQGGQVPICKAGEMLCGFICVSKTDPAYGCGNDNCKPCGKFDHATTVCSNSQCSPGVCDSGYDNCNQNAQDGCEIKLASDPKHCGKCGNVCGSGSCEAGICNPTCGPDNKIVSTVGVSLCWVLGDQQKPANTYMSMGGSVDQPNKPDIVSKPFPGCVADSKDDFQLVCKLGDLESKTILQLIPYMAKNPEGEFIWFMCGETQYPNDSCKGEITIYQNGIVVSTFKHPPSGSWSYVDVQGREELKFVSLP